MEERLGEELDDVEDDGIRLERMNVHNRHWARGSTRRESRARGSDIFKVMLHALIRI